MTQHIDMPQHGPQGAPRRGFVSLIGAGPGAADLITLRGASRLAEADAVFFDRLIDRRLLEHARPDAELVCVGKAPGAHGWPQPRINAALAAAGRAGKRVARLKCGDPGMFGRVVEEIVALDAAGVAWEIVPGVTAASAAAAAAGSALTARGETDTLVATTGRTRDGDPDPDWIGQLRPGVTLALYMAVAAAPRIATRLLAQGAPGALPVEVIASAGTPEQAIVNCRLDALAATMRARGVANPAIILIRWPRRFAAAAAATAAAPLAPAVLENAA